jgi:nitrite reductase/ring-hydroxylating ferredoxin subunit
MKHRLIDLADIPDAGTVLVPFFGREVHVWRHGDGARAAVNVCLHLGGPLECRDGRLVCPWHGAAYDLASGRKTEGPGPDGARLMVLPTRAEDGALYYMWGE